MGLSASKLYVKLSSNLTYDLFFILNDEVKRGNMPVSSLRLTSEGWTNARSHHRDLEYKLILTYPQRLELELFLGLKVSSSILTRAANAGSRHHALVHVGSLIH
jgi:hypothetical protein